MATFIKDPSDVLDYDWDFTEWLGTDTIALYSFSVPPGLINQSDSRSGGVTKVFLAGGSTGQTYTVSCQITTLTGRTLERSLKIKIKEL
jgi:hypothetical protein